MLPETLLLPSGNLAFLNCRALVYVIASAGTITSGFETVSNCVEVILSKNLKTIYNCAFMNCVSLSLIDIPEMETGALVFEGLRKPCKPLSCKRCTNPCLKALSTDAASVLSASPLP